MSSGDLTSLLSSSQWIEGNDVVLINKDQPTNTQYQRKFLEDDSAQFPEIKKYDENFFFAPLSRRVSKRENYVRKHRRIEMVLRHEFRTKQEKNSMYMLGEYLNDNIEDENSESSSEEEYQLVKKRDFPLIDVIPYIPSDVERFKKHLARLNTKPGFLVEPLNIPKVHFMDWYYGINTHLETTRLVGFTIARWMLIMEGDVPTYAHGSERYIPNNLSKLDSLAHGDLVFSRNDIVKMMTKRKCRCMQREEKVAVSNTMKEIGATAKDVVRESGLMNEQTLMNWFQGKEHFDPVVVFETRERIIRWRERVERNKQQHVNAYRNKSEETRAWVAECSMSVRDIAAMSGQCGNLVPFFDFMLGMNPNCNFSVTAANEVFELCKRLQLKSFIELTRASWERWHELVKEEAGEPYLITHEDMKAMNSLDVLKNHNKDKTNLLSNGTSDVTKKIIRHVLLQRKSKILNLNGIATVGTKEEKSTEVEEEERKENRIKLKRKRHGGVQEKVKDDADMKRRRTHQLTHQPIIMKTTPRRHILKIRCNGKYIGKCTYIPWSQQQQQNVYKLLFNK